MRFGVIAESVAALEDFRGESRESAHVRSHHEESSLRIVPVEQVEKRGSDFGIRAVVESQSDGAWVAGLAPRAPENLRRGDCGSIRIPSRRCAHRTKPRPYEIVRHCAGNFLTRHGCAC